MKKLPSEKLTAAAGKRRFERQPQRQAPQTRETREMCGVHGWVGRRAFSRDRHDLCEVSADAEAANEEDVDPEVEESVVEDVTVEDGPRWGRAGPRHRGIPPKRTVAARRITQLELKAGRAELQVLGADEPYDRPIVRGDCQACPACQLVRDGKSTGFDESAFRALDLDPVPLRLGTLACGHRLAEVVQHSRPCVFIACKHALYLDTSETGSIIFNFPHLEPGEMRPDQSCSLDLADRGGMTLEEIAEVTNLTRERIRQVELRTLIRRARPAAVALGLGAEDAAEAGIRRRVSPGADLVETGVDGEIPSDVATILVGNSRDGKGGS